MENFKYSFVHKDIFLKKEGGECSTLGEEGRVSC